MRRWYQGARQVEAEISSPIGGHICLKERTIQQYNACLSTYVLNMIGPLGKSAFYLNTHTHTGIYLYIYNATQFMLLSQLNSCSKVAIRYL